MGLIKAGLPLSKDAANFPEGLHFNYTYCGHSLIWAVDDPSAHQIAEIQGADGAFGLFVHKTTLCLLVKFGDLPWQAAHYNWWINPPIMRPEPGKDLRSLSGGISLGACLVDAATGIVRALRSMTMPRDFGRILLQNVRTQAVPPFDPWGHTALIENINRAYPSAADMMREAICMCAFGRSMTEQNNTHFPRSRF